jgi:hypothetical protein
LSSVKSRFERWADDEGAKKRRQDQAQKIPQPNEDVSEVVGGGGEDGIGGIAGAAFEIAAAEVAFGLHVADHGLDGGASPQFAFDDTEERRASVPR